MKMVDGEAAVIYMYPHGTRTGPTLTDHNGELDTPVKTCKGCVHFGVHEWHHYYCSAQKAQNRNPEYSSPYPWRGAGAQMNRPDAENCPYDKETQDGNVVSPD
jgi:hypothetical protein